MCLQASWVPPSPDVPSGISSAGFQPFLIGDDLRQPIALKQTLSIFLTLLVFLFGGFVHASVDSSFRSQRPSSDFVTVSEGATTLTRTYDGRGRLKTFTTGDGDLIQYQYDANNSLIRLTYPDGKRVSYTYNARNLLATVTDWSGRLTTYTYDRLGRLTGTIRPNGTSNQIAHDAANQLTSIKESAGGKLINYLAFQYDAASQIKSRFRAPLVNSGWQHPTFAASYDDDNRLLTVNGQTVTHDADGNMTYGPIAGSAGVSPTFNNLTYNSRNQLTIAAGVSYNYDAEGRRRSFTDATGTTREVIDPSGKLLIRILPSGAKTYYVYGLGLLYEADEADATKTYHFDQVGSAIARTDDTGKVIGRAEYSAYGLITMKEGDMATPFLYNGQAGVQTDANGLLNMRARYYSPYLMRFLNADPIGFSGGSNWFAYADGNPISLSDPFGLCATQAQWDRAGELWEADRARLPDPGIRDATFDVQFALGVPGIARGLTELGAAAIGKGLSVLGRGEANTVANQVPSTMARVIPDMPITRASGTLGKAGDSDVFVTAAGDIRGLNAQQISKRLTIPQSPTGFRVIEFPTPGSGVASPVFRSDPGFIGGGRTLGGAREFVIPNGTIPAGSRTTIIGP